jgi:hypothetical protein
LISGLILKVNRCNKLIRIAEKSTALVREYESEDLASDSDDEKRIRQAENRVLFILVQFLFQCSGSPHSKHASL